MPEVVFALDSTKKFTEQKLIGHNRWHYAIPAAVQVKPGDSFRVHCREWFDGAIHNDDSADDVRDAPLSTVHVLSGPIGVEGAKPGDLLVVDILDVGPIPQEDSGPLAARFVRCAKRVCQSPGNRSGRPWGIWINASICRLRTRRTPSLSRWI